MRISLIICTRNRAEPLKRCLESIARLEYSQEWEFVLVDNGSTDATEQVAKEFAATASFPVRYVFQPVKGLSNARNAGLAQAVGELIAFTDDDCYPWPDFLEKTDRAFDDPTIGYVSGRILLHDPTDYPATINESTTPLRFAPGQFLAAGEIKGANLAFRRALLDEVGGFDPAFGSGALFPSEDVDTAARISRLGWAGAYDPDIVVSHHHGRKEADIGSLKKHYAVGRGAYHAKIVLHDKSMAHGLKGWRGLPRRTLDWGPNLWWELSGAFDYAKHWMAGGAQQDGGK